MKPLDVLDLSLPGPGKSRVSPIRNGRGALFPRGANGIEVKSIDSAEAEHFVARLGEHGR
jgi:hypothetical protein